MSCNSSTNKTNKQSYTFEKIQIDASIIVHKDSLHLNGNEGNWYYKDKLFNGFGVKYYANNSLKEKTGFFKGKKQGVYKVWFENGMLKMASHYHQNTLEGSYKSWWNSGVLASEVTYKNGKAEGVERKWFRDGTLSKERNLLAGREDGLQKAWLENGKLYVNYEAKNGRIFGMRRANSCYKLENEKLVEKKISNN